MARPRRPPPQSPAPPPAGADLLAEVASATAAADEPRASAATDALALLAAVPVCGTARIVGLDGDVVRLAFGTEVLPARRDPCVHPTVLQGALQRGERVLAEHRPAEGWVVVGALRTQPTPGIDVAEGFTIAADRVHIKAESEVAISAKAASLVVRALGEVETYAERILSRAEGIHRIVGRILHLN